MFFAGEDHHKQLAVNGIIAQITSDLMHLYRLDPDSAARFIEQLKSPAFLASYQVGGANVVDGIMDE